MHNSTYINIFSRVYANELVTSQTPYLQFQGPPLTVSLMNSLFKDDLMPRLNYKDTQRDILCGHLK